MQIVNIYALRFALCDLQDMAEFNYQVKDQRGEFVQGVLEAHSVDAAVETLHKRGFVILSLEETEKGLFEKDLISFLSRPNRKDIVIFTRQLSTLIDANIPLVEGLDTLARQTPKESFKKIISKISKSIEGGSSLSQAASEHKIFDPFFISLIKSGEVSGRLQSTLLYLADYLERSAELTSKIRGALAYPAFVVFAISAVGIIMMTTVLPKLLEVLKEAGVQELPITTRILIFITDMMNRFIYIFFGVLALIVWYLKNWINTPEGRFKFDMIKIKITTIGEVIKGVYLARTAEALSTLIKAGVPILEALTITSDIVGHSLFKKILLEAEENVRNGGSISEVFGRYREIPTMVTSMIAIGEKTGKTDFMLENIYKFYKSESDRSIQNISQLIEPILVLFLGLVVGILVASILLPIYNLVGVG